MHSLRKELTARGPFRYEVHSLCSLVYGCWLHLWQV